MNAVVEMKPTSLVTKFAGRYGVDADKLLNTLKATAFRQKDDQPISNEQMMALLVVADQYKLNPFTKEIFAFPDKYNGIVPVVGVDGWCRIINEHPQLDGIEFRYSDETVDHKGHKCHEWIECAISRKDRSKPIVVREYFGEVVRELKFTTPWDTHPNRLHRHKALIQCARVAFGFAGIYDDDEADRVIDMGAAQVVVEQPKPKNKPKTVAQEPNSGGGQARVESTPPVGVATPAAAAPNAAPSGVTAGSNQRVSGRVEPVGDESRVAPSGGGSDAEQVQTGAATIDQHTLAECLAVLDEQFQKGAVQHAILQIEPWRSDLTAEDLQTLDSTIEQLLAEQESVNAKPAEPPKKLMIDGQKRILRARLKSNNKTITQLEDKFGGLDTLAFDQFEEIQKWVTG